MAKRLKHTCQCQEKARRKRGRGGHLGLNELMIVNPGPPGAEALFLGEDGRLYQVQGLDEGALPGQGEYFLGEEGALYWAQGSSPSGSNGLSEGEEQLPRRFFLGEDGTLYELVG
jgi:hypothetical protein